MKKILTKLLETLKVDKETENLSDDRLTNKKLLEKFASHFDSILKAESVGKRILYPMSFIVLMDPADYNDRRESLPFVLPEVVSAFYGIINAILQEHPDYDYTPPAKYWSFQFSACKLGTLHINDTTSVDIKRGDMKIIPTLYAYDFRNESNVSAENDIRISIKLQDSDVYRTFNVNQEAIRNIDILGDGIFKCYFDKKLNRDVLRIGKSFNFAEINGIAELSYSKAGRNYSFMMKDNLIHISGKNEMRKGSSFFILESPDIKDSHVQIKYLPSEKKFQIAAYGLTKLNGRRITESRGGDVRWHDLANKSSIFVNDEISVKFEIK